jgi:hypothetical protein
VPSLEEVNEAAAVFDQNGNGYISVDELRHVMKNLGEGLDDATLDAMVKAAEPDSEQQVCQAPTERLGAMSRFAPSWCHRQINIRHFVSVLMSEWWLPAHVIMRSNFFVCYPIPPWRLPSFRLVGDVCALTRTPWHPLMQ